MSCRRAVCLLMRMTKNAKVCVIGKTVVDNLFTDGEDPLARTIRFKQIPLKVIGILESKGQNQMGQDQDDIIIAPLTPVQKRILAQTYLQMIFASATSEADADAATEEITQVLRENHKLSDSQDNGFDVRTQAEMLKMMNSISGYLTHLLAAVASSH